MFFPRLQKIDSDTTGVVLSWFRSHLACGSQSVPCAGLLCHDMWGQDITLAIDLSERYCYG